MYSGRVTPSILEEANGSNTRIIIDVEAQKGYLLVNEKVAASCVVSTAKPGKHTPLGTFAVTEKVRSGKISTIYNVSMPYWMRLDGLAIGLHAGYVPGYPASAGCIRLPYDMARLFYDHTASGTPVTICNNWTGV
jgi:lipoprotein-anchoring transpeptidase ErfK/SrfK